MIASTALSGGCTPSKPSGPGTAAPTPAKASIADDLQVIGPTVVIDPEFTPDPKHLPKPVDRPEVRSLDFSQDGTRLVVRSSEALNGLQVWNVSDRPTRARSWDRRPGLTSVGVLSQDGKRFVYTPEGHWTGVIVDVDSGRTLTELKAYPDSPLAFATAEVLFGFRSTSDSNKAGRSTVLTIDAATGGKRSEFVLHEGKGFLRWSRPFDEGRMVAVVRSGDPTIEVWDVINQQLVRQVKEPFENPQVAGGRPFVNSTGTRMASGVPPGTRLAGADVGSSLIFWDGNSGEALAVLPNESGVHFADFLPGREVFLMTTNALREEKRRASPEVVAYDLLTKAYTAVFRGGHQGHITALAVAPNGRWLATGDNVGRVQLWDLRQLR